MLHQKIHAMLFQRNRKRSIFGHAMHKFDIFHIQLKAARSTFVGAHLAAHHHARLLGQHLDALEDLRRHGGFRHNALHRSGAIAKNWKQQLAAFAQVVKPAAQRDGLALKTAQFSNGGERRGGRGR